MIDFSIPWLYIYVCVCALSAVYQGVSVIYTAVTYDVQTIYYFSW